MFWVFRAIFEIFREGITSISTLLAVVDDPLKINSVFEMKLLVSVLKRFIFKDILMSEFKKKYSKGSRKILQMFLKKFHKDGLKDAQNND